MFICNTFLLLIKFYRYIKFNYKITNIKYFIINYSNFLFNIFIHSLLKRIFKNNMFIVILFKCRNKFQLILNSK